MVDIRRINPPELGEPPGYSQIVETCGGRTIYIAGQTALDAGGKLVGKDDLPAQAAQVFLNLSTALDAVQCAVANVVKLHVYLRDMSNLAAYREARNRFLDQTVSRAAPAVTLVEVLSFTDWIYNRDRRNCRGLTAQQRHSRATADGCREFPHQVLAA